MRLGTLDIAILIFYFVAMIGIGVYVTKRASRNLDSYFLGGKRLPWWLLGISNASAMWDITGTMWLVYILFTYGMTGVFLPWLWPTFNQIFLMIYLARWIRRSNVLTGAEWITTRFGAGRGGELSRAVIVVFALVSVVAFISYDFQGMGKFCAVFLPWEFSPNTYAVVIMSVTAIYVVLGGMLSVVLTDFAQFILMAISSVAIGVIAMLRVSPDRLDAAIPAGWRDLFFGWNLDLDWSNILPAMNQKIADDGMASLFALFFLLMVMKGALVSVAGPAPNYDMQRVLAAKNPKEAGFMSGIVSMCLVPRWMMIGGVTVLGLVFMGPQFKTMGDNIDFELVLPYVINHFLPAGLTGIILAGLLSAFMSTFSATVNAGAAYLVNDLYKRYVNPGAEGKKLVRASYVGSVFILIVGMAFGFAVSSINQVTQWIVSGLYGGYTAANVLKWHWWRLNGFGYFWGMVAGIGAALLMPVVAPTLHPLYGFPFVLVFSLIACLLGSLWTKPEDEDVLKRFYRQVRPWGFWTPVHDLVVKDEPGFRKNDDFVRDVVNCAVGIAWQLTLVMMPLYLIFRDRKGLWISVGIFVVTSMFLKKFWYDHLARESADAAESDYRVASSEAPA